MGPLSPTSLHGENRWVRPPIGINAPFWLGVAHPMARRDAHRVRPHEEGDEAGGPDELERYAGGAEAVGAACESLCDVDPKQLVLVRQNPDGSRRDDQSDWR
jgi:hypothetical protein